MSRRVVHLLLCCFLFGIAACFSQTFTDGPSGAVNADGRIEIFARGSDGAAWHNWQNAPGGPWVGWNSLGGGIAGSPIAAINADGRLDVFVRNGGNIVYHNYQVSPGGGWSGWIPLGAGNIATPPVVAKNFDGRLQLFALGTDGGLWTAYQQIPGDNWSGWTSLGGFIGGSPSVAENADGRLEVFVLGGGDGALYHNWQTSPGGAWSGFAVLAGDGNMATAPTVGVDDDGRLEVFAQTTDGAGFHIWQTSPGGAWSGGASLGGGITGSPTVELDGGTNLEAFAISPGGAPWVDYESNGWAGWNSLGGLITAAPAIAMNFDGRLEIFGIGTDGAVYHDWQDSPAGSWVGWQPISTPSNSGTTNGADMSYFVGDAQDDAYYASMKGQQCPGNMPNLWRGVLNGMIYAWPCGSVVNTSFVAFKNIKPLTDAMFNWENEISTWYQQYFNGQNSTLPVLLATESGGPQRATVDHSACDTCLKDDKGNLARGVNVGQQRDASNRLAFVNIKIIKGIHESTALRQVFAHELGHTFGLIDCPVNAVDPNNNPLYDCSKTVMAAGLILAGHGWDDTAKNANVTYTPSYPPPNGLGNTFELLSGPTACDMSIIDQNLPDYRACYQLSDNTQQTPTCTDGTAVGFEDTGGASATYTCDGQVCNGCNPQCSNYQPGALGTNCGGGSGGGTCPNSANCDDFSPGVFATDYCLYPQGGCPDGYYDSNYCCYNGTPIVIDAFKEGFHLTNLSNGVNFRVHPNESLYQVSWTDPQYHNGWLALDRNGNGTIDDFTELFGNFTPQAPSSTPNGYVALAVFDDPMNGGNGNGVIDPGDSVYDSLRVWIDANHNGVSEPEELHTLRELGIFRIGLNYTLSQYADANGNHFRYRAQTWDGAGGSHNACYDVVVQFSKLKGNN